jgi:hypothetical protein
MFSAQAAFIHMIECAPDLVVVAVYDRRPLNEQASIRRRLTLRSVNRTRFEQLLSRALTASATVGKRAGDNLAVKQDDQVFPNPGAKEKEKPSRLPKEQPMLKAGR